MKKELIDFENALAIIKAFEQFENALVVYWFDRKLDSGIVCVLKESDSCIPTILLTFYVSKKDLFGLFRLNL